MSYESRIRRRGELRSFFDEWDMKLLDKMIEKERRQKVAQMACRAIHYHIQRSRMSAGTLTERSSTHDLYRPL